MGCSGQGRKHAEVRPEQKWDYISLKDFKSGSCLTVMAYGYLFLSLLLSIAVYGVDTFTAVNLLVFDKWSGAIAPTQLVPFDVSKWIFSICIIASFINLGFEHIRAMRIMKRGSVAECYLDNLAVRLESSRMGKGQGWRRFLVFAELTKSKKGAEYIALFTYFSFQSWIRVIFCSGPRQAVNALTLYAVYSSALIPADGGSVDKTLLNFFGKIETLAAEDIQQALILSGMLFTLVIWIFGAISLLLAAMFYVFFLWHYIPRQDGGLSGYCERKINKRLMKIVSAKVNKAIAKEERDRARAERKAAMKNGEKLPVGRQATLPTFMDAGKDDKLPDMPMLNRTDTMGTLPPYTSRPGTPGSIELSSFDQKRPLPTRQGTMNTMASQSSFSSRAPLVGGASPMGMDRSASPAPTLPQIDMSNYPPVRPGTAQSNRSFAGGPQMPPLHRVQTSVGSSFGAFHTASPSTYSPDSLPAMPERILSPAPQGSMDSYNRPMPRAVNQLGGRPQMYDNNGRSSTAPSMPRSVDQFSGRPGPPGRPMYDDNMSVRDGRSSPAPSTYSSRGPPANGPGYNGPSFPPPMRSATNPMPSPQRQHFGGPPQRNMTAPMPMPMQQRQPENYYAPPARPGTASSQRSLTRPSYGYGYNGDVEAQRGPQY